MVKRRPEDGLSTPLGLPRNLLVPYILLYLKNLSTHGYQILQTLTLLGFAALDFGTVYRTLRQMEKDGLLLSNWETNKAGPARRTYQITANGEALLAQWADALSAYQKFLDRFFLQYANPSALQPPFAAAPSEHSPDTDATLRHVEHR